MSRLPTFGVMDHLTAVFVVPTTLAVNCADCPADSPAGPGMIETLTFARLTEAVASIASRAVTDMNSGPELFVSEFSDNCDDNSTTVTK